MSTVSTVLVMQYKRAATRLSNSRQNETINSVVSDLPKRDSCNGTVPSDSGSRLKRKEKADGRHLKPQSKADFPNVGLEPRRVSQCENGVPGKNPYQTEMTSSIRLSFSNEKSAANNFQNLEWTEATVKVIQPVQPTSYTGGSDSESHAACLAYSIHRWL